MNDFDPSIKRIKKFVEKKTGNPPQTTKKTEKHHKYQKTLSVTSSIKTLSSKKNSPRSLKKANILSSQKGKIHLEQFHCTINQNYPLSFIKKLGNIKSIHYKEKLIAMRNLKNFSHEMQKWIYAHIPQDVKIFKEGEDPWHDLQAKREERHFQIDRIIKYLSEI